MNLSEITVKKKETNELEHVSSKMKKESRKSRPTIIS